MKKLFLFLLTAVAITACQKEPDLSDLDDDYVVFTDYDRLADFGTFTTFYMPDSILLITEKQEATYWTNSEVKYILEALEENMTGRGYTRIEEKGTADMGLQISYIENTNYLVNYVNNYWWYGYPGYWGPGYWGPGWTGGWYYPYPVVYSYSIGSFLIELIDLTDADNSRRLRIVWDSYMAGYLSGSSRVNRDLAIQAVDQAFVQSPYLTRQ